MEINQILMVTFPLKISYNAFIWVACFETKTHTSTFDMQRLNNALTTLLHDVGCLKNTNQLSVNVTFDGSNSFFARNILA